MRYRLGLTTAAQHTPVELTAEEYEAIRAAKRDLIVFVGIEGKFDLLIANYLEYEKTLLDLAAEEMVYQHGSWHDDQDDIQLVGRRLLNVLSAARLYLDQVAHDFGVVHPDGTERQGKLRSEQFDAKWGYRLMEALRNYIQHNSMPVHELAYPWVDTAPGDPAREYRYMAVPALDPSQLRVNEKFRKQTLEEIREKHAANGGKPFALTPLLREYIEGLGKVNEALREQSAADVQRCGELIAATVARGRREVDARSLGLAVIAEEDDGREVAADHVFDDLWDRWRRFVKRNQRYGGLARRHVSGRGAQE